MSERTPSATSAGPAQSPVLEFESSATTPAATKPSAPSTASAPPVGSRSSATSRATAMTAMTTTASIGRLSAFALVTQGAAFDVGLHRLFVGVLALFEKDEIAGPVVKGGVGEAEGAEAGFDALVRIGVARVGDRGLG